MTLEPAAAPAEVSLLTLLGLGPDEDTVYRLLVDRPNSAPADLAGLLGEAVVNRALDALVEQGLAHCRQAGDGGAPRYRAAPPVLALGPLLESHRSALHRVEFLVADLAERHRAAQGRAAGAPVEVLSGGVAIRRRLIAMQRQAEHEACSLVPVTQPVAITIADNADEAERESMRRGVVLRSVVERDLLEHPDSAAMLGQLAAEGQQIAVVRQLPIKMLIVDRRVALLPLDPERDETEPVALVVHRSGLLTALTALFEQYFSQGRRLGDAGETSSPARPDSSVEPLDRQILGLLRIGLTDAAIARQLGIGRRTVQRRLHNLMERADASTRFQLGWHAAQSGWAD
ncbi:helix-turn-helix transcriptional regulator [Streptomyces sp. NPDC002928]|uniref:helix-turn-helix transcriptional regulator n=1 Tax=Streptomyces sp. NPDC002928 TaxID=3154440 RepID=UPI0033A1628D